MRTSESKRSADLLGASERLRRELEELREVELDLRERQNELKGQMRELEEAIRALKILLEKAETRVSHVPAGASPGLQGKVVYIVGPRSLRNELLVSCLEQATGVKCVVGEDLSSVLPAGAADDEVRPGLVLLDCQGKDRRGILAEFSVHLKQWQRGNHVALFNVSRDQGIEGRCVSEGIRGFFYEPDTLEIFLKGVRAIFSGQLWLSREVMARCILESENRADPSRIVDVHLTPRQTEILALVAVGAKDETVAERLCISHHTVRTHVYNIFKKIKVSNRLEAALWAAKNL
jgi:LuxR family transcriptional regulator of csgAB operon